MPKGRDARLRQPVNPVAGEWSVLGEPVPSYGTKVLPRLPLDHDQPPPPVTVRHWYPLDAVSAPLAGAPELPRLPAVEPEQLSRDREHGDLSPAARTRALGARTTPLVEPRRRVHR